MDIQYGKDSVYFFPIGDVFVMESPSAESAVLFKMDVQAVGYIDFRQWVDGWWAVKIGDVEGWAMGGAFSFVPATEFHADDVYRQYKLTIRIDPTSEIHRALRDELDEFIGRLREAGCLTEILTPYDYIFK